MATTPLPQKRPPKDEGEYHEHRQFEDQLINHRLTWLLGCESLLFAGYAVLLTKEKVKDGLIAQHQFNSALKWIPWLGIGVATLIEIGIIAAIWASVILWLRPELGNHAKNLGVFWGTTILGWIPPLVLPLLFSGAWILMR